MLTVGSLFAGIGGFDLGFERAGMRTLWQVEQNEFCRRVLERHFPDAQRFEDVRDVGAVELAPVDIICGGFPCQDLSYAGRGAGLEGERSGLWSEYARIVGELRPRYVVVENVTALLGRGLGRVLGDLAEIGYDAEWDCLPAAAFGAPHIRDRFWLVAYPGCERSPRRGTGRSRRGESGDGGSDLCRPAPEVQGPSDLRAVGNADCMARETTGPRNGRPGAVDEPRSVERPFRPGSRAGDAWLIEPDLGRVADGVPARMDRLAALGNALVPQIAEWIGRRIIEWEEGSVRAA